MKLDHLLDSAGRSPYPMTRLATLAIFLSGSLLAAGCCVGVDALDLNLGSGEEVVSPEDQKYMDAAKPFVDAVVAKNYAAAYEKLSSHARARMSLNQFAPAANDGERAKREAEPLKDVTSAQFAEKFALTIEALGEPSRVDDIAVNEKDPAVLSGKGDRINVGYALGDTPDALPADIRRAAMLATVGTKLNPEQLKKLAAEYGSTPEEVQQDYDGETELMLILILVEEGGELKVGYFQFRAPSLLD